MLGVLLVGVLLAGVLLVGVLLAGVLLAGVLLAGMLLVRVLLPGMVSSAFGDGYNGPPPLRAFCRLARPPEYEPEGEEGLPGGLGGD